MARPRVNIDEKIRKAIPVKFSNTDIFKIRAEAKKERIPVSTLIRKLTLEGLNNK